MQADYSHSSSICMWSHGLQAELDTRLVSPTECCQRSKPFGLRDIKSTQDLSVRPVELSFLCVPHCPCLVSVPSFKWHRVNVKKTNFGNGVGDVSLGHPSEMLFACSSPLPSLFCLSCKQANSLLGGIELPCLGFLLISCLDTGVALKERLVKTNHHLFFGEKKHEKKEKKSGLLSLCPSKLPKVLLWGEGTSRVLSFCSCLASKLSGPWGVWGGNVSVTKPGWAPPRNDGCSQKVGLLMVAIWAGRRGSPSFSMKL